MGALHEGHLSLVRAAKQECDTVVVSVFVNPAQFNDPNDLDSYPRDLERDKEILGKEDVDVIFAPSKNEIYPEDTPKGPDVDLGKLTEQMEGRFRPGHFEGVMMVLDRLFRIVEPDRAYFGKKDYQQLVVVKHMVKELGSSIGIEGVETVRESSGLALSSRNEKLDPSEKEQALIIYNSMKRMREMTTRTKDARELKNYGEQQLDGDGSFRLEYIEIADGETLEPIDVIDDEREARVFVAGYLGSVRLIDNMALNR